ncbi:MAG: tetratricopeptide repeat protein [Pseudomonadota bacterium]
MVAPINRPAASSGDAVLDGAPLAERGVDLLRDLAMFMLQFGQLDQADELLGGLIAVEPDGYATHMLTGMLAFGDKRYRDAEVAYRRMLEKYPDDPGTHAYVAEAIFAQRRPREALGLLEQAEQVGAPDDPGLDYVRALREDYEKGTLQKRIFGGG